MTRAELRSLNISDRYRTDLDDVLADFYIPCLRVATRYDRAVGYFTGDALRLVARGLRTFQGTGGHIRMIASPHLTQDDVAQIKAGYERREVIERAVVRQLDPDTFRIDAAIVEELGLLGRLIASGCLDIKVAVVHTASGMSLYHEKIGIFADERGDTVAFNGSMNETVSAFLTNFESVEVFASWREADRVRAHRIALDFENLWEDRSHNVEVLPFPEAARKRLLAIARLNDPRLVDVRDARSSASSTQWAYLPEDLDLRSYQKDAVDSWLVAGGRGILRMATGTGKTITALAAVDQLGRQLRQKSFPLLTVIVVPLLDLVEQWDAQLERFGVRPIKCRDSSAGWVPLVRGALTLLHEGEAETATLVVTNKTFGGPVFQDLLKNVRTPMLLVADEAHHLGAKHLRDALPTNAQYRLGLSATPERWFDEEGTAALTEYFGHILLKLDLAEAIRIGALTPYQYSPVLVPLTPDENEHYVELTKRIGALMAASGGVPPEDNVVLDDLMRRRSQILGHAEGKIPALRAELAKRRDSWYQLVYCAEGSPPQFEESGPGKPRQVDKVLRTVGKEMGLAAHPFTSREDKQERLRLLSRFSRGDDLRLLVSMRCLDEGVDVPDARVAYMLASSGNPRQFVQRRGRILRRAPGKDMAEIVDFVAVPQQTPDLYTIERKLFRRELARCLEFARHSNNFGHALSVLRPLREYYDILETSGELEK